LGLAAYNGQREIVADALKKGIDWDAEGPYLLSSAIFGRNWDIARDILRSGMPITDSTYSHIYYYADHSLLDELPPRPDILVPLLEETLQAKLVEAIIEGDLNQVRTLFKKDWVDLESKHLGDKLSRRLIHYAARDCRYEILKFLLEANAKVNELTGDNHSALTLVTQCSETSKKNRKKCFRLIRAHGGEMTPSANGWFEEWLFSQGVWNSR